MCVFANPVIHSLQAQNDKQGKATVVGKLLSVECGRSRRLFSQLASYI